MIFQSVLFDKIINLRLVRSDGTFDEIKTPLNGVKPDITVSGEFLPASIMNAVKIRIVNFYPDVPLSEYKYVLVEAGYSGNILTAIHGRVNVAFQETPSPDGATIFELACGPIDDAINTPYNTFFPPKTPLNTIIRALANELGLTAQTSLPESYFIGVGLYASGTISDFIQKLSQATGTVLKPDGEYLIAYERGGKTGVVHDIVFFNGPPKKDAGNITFQAPWIPSMRTGDVVSFNPKFMRESFGGSMISFGQFLSVLRYSFDFSTVSDHNQMSVVCKGA